MYNNPYYYPYMNRMNMADPSMRTTNILKPKLGLFKGFSNIKWGTVLNNTQKTLNVINQAIPVYYQIKPIFTNIKSFGKLMNAFNEENDNSHFNKIENQENITKKENKNSPTFFID